MNAKDKIKILFNTPQDVFKLFHIDKEKGYIYNRNLWNKNKPKRVGRPTTGNLYTRISVSCPSLKHIFKRGHIDVMSHRLIFYAFTGKLPEKVDHIRKDIEYPDALSNLRESDSFHNRLNTNKIKRKRLSNEERTDNSPSAFRERILKNFRGIYYAYKYYWALYDKEILNSEGFVSPILAVNCRNNFIKKLYIEKYGSLKDFPENALDIIDENELFLDQMTQDAVQNTKDYKEKQKQIKLEMKKRSEETLKRKISANISQTDCPFECIGKYE